jgi:hypothetical protein
MNCLSAPRILLTSPCLQPAKDLCNVADAHQGIVVTTYLCVPDRAERAARGAARLGLYEGQVRWRVPACPAATHPATSAADLANQCPQD